MIRHTFTLPKYDWFVTSYIAVTGYYVDEIMDKLIDIGCRGEYLERADENLTSGRIDTGLTFSDYHTHRTVMVIALTSSPKEFAQSWRHEMGHLADHIAQVYGIDTHGEELQYIGDDIVDKMWDVAHQFLCERCRPKRLQIETGNY